jgi:hypothetical protein
MRLRTRLTAMVTAVAAVLCGGSAGAGLLDSPPPALGNAVPGTVVYRMGAVHYEPGGWVDTTVTCTNLATTPSLIALEVFNETDTRVGDLAKATVEPNASVIFATSADAAPNAVAVAGLPAIDHGKARVVASTTKLNCTAVNHMRANDGVIKEAPLELVKKVAF